MNIVLRRVTLLQLAKQAAFIPKTLLHQLVDALWFHANICLCFTLIVLIWATDLTPLVLFYLVHAEMRAR